MGGCSGEEELHTQRGLFLNLCVTKSKMETIKTECVFASEPESLALSCLQCLSEETCHRLVTSPMYHSPNYQSWDAHTLTSFVISTTLSVSSASSSHPLNFT